MSKKFSDLSSDERGALIKNIGELLNKHGLSADVKSVREVVCDMKADSIEDNQSLVISKELPPSKKEAAAAFNAEVKSLVEGIEGIQINLNSVVGAGQKYSTISNVTTIADDAETSLEHQAGEVLLIDFWATWCPPCQGPMKHN